MLEWLGRLPAEEVDRRPRLLLAAAWSLALSDRHDEAGRLVARILAQPGVDDALHCECALILSGAAVFADDPDRFAELHDPWAENPPLRDPLLRKIHANRSAFRALLDGEPALARLRQQRDAAQRRCNPTMGYLSRWGDFIVGLSYLWEGQVQLAAKLLRPALAQAEADLGRRSPFAAMLARVAGRRRVGARPAGRGRGAAGQPAGRARAQRPAGDRAARLPHDGAHRGGRRRREPRARTAGRDACGGRGAPPAAPVRRQPDRPGAAACAPLPPRDLPRAVRADRCPAGRRRQPAGRLWRRSVEVLRELAFGHAAIAAQDWRRALEPLARADALAQQLKQGRLHIELLGLRAFVLDRCGEKSLGLLREAADLAQTYGLQRVFDDAHPALGDWARQALRSAGRRRPGAAGPLAAPMRAPPAAAEAARLRSNPSMALTPKEREVLELLARNLSNKEIGLAMQVGEATIKWHMKNLFAKLDAGTRKQVVQRARILGLLDTRVAGWGLPPLRWGGRRRYRGA